MDFSFLPEEIARAVEKINKDKLFEIRLRRDFPIQLNIDGKKAFLNENGYSLFSNGALLCNESDISHIIGELTEHSVYAFNDKIKNGYLPAENGIRVGLAGECVYDGERLITIKNITSLNIRVPHEIKGCSEKIYGYIVENNEIKNTLIISPPFFGKTTLLKDLARKLDERQKRSILIIDERGEFETVKGINIDKIRYSDKLYALTFGLRSMSPEIVITDELVEKNDWKCALSAVNSGLFIIASCHAKNINDLQRKDFFMNNIFERYIVLDDKNYFGVVKEVFNGDFDKL